MKSCASHPDSPRYPSNNKCVACVAEFGKRYFAKNIERRGNYRIGLPTGFIRFGTVAHRILVHIHTDGPSTHDELVRTLNAPGISTNLRRLQEFGFLFQIGRQRSADNIRSGAVFNITKSKAGFVTERVLTNNERLAQYRARKRAKKLCVPSVFEFRGSVSL